MTNHTHAVNFAAPRGFAASFKADCKETFFPDDPFYKLNHEKPLPKLKKTIQYFIPLFEWLPNYNLRLFRYDLLAGLTITTLAVPQGISYAKLANIPPIYGLSETIGEKASPKDNPTLYLHLIFTATFFTGIFQIALGFLRLGILVDFLPHSTITGFIGGTAIIICLQQLKGIFGVKHFTTNTDVVSVLRALFRHRDEWRWQSAVVGLIFLAFLQSNRYVREKRPKLFWVSAIAPMIVVVVGCFFAFFGHAEKHGIAIKKGLNPPSIQYLNFDPRYLPVTVRAGIITGLITLTEGIAIGQSFAIMKNEQTDGNKEMIAFGFMNIIGSFTSCYLTTGPFSKTAVNFNTGCRTAMSNVIMGFCMMLTLLFLAPLFGYTPLVALSAFIMSAMHGLINYEEMIHLFKVDKFDFVICMTAFLGVSFISMDVGLMLSVGIYSTLVCGKACCLVLRYIPEEQGVSDSTTDVIEHLLLDLSGVSSIDMTGFETFVELRRILGSKGIQLLIVNPSIQVPEKMTLANFTDVIGKESFYLSIEDAVQSCRFSLLSNKTTTEESSNHVQTVV
ncbi:hypothetical protein V6N13_097894 [Hibiscus sabdariffa]|uniref:STAS domain-containing protein n=1 Tax=Hibiscus sabdariffa TaxID=183260 RepID=A0ABR2NV00_9ROSI